MTTDLDRATVEEAYARWAPVYDVVFGAVFDAGRKAAIKAAEKIGGRILEFSGGPGAPLPRPQPPPRQGRRHRALPLPTQPPRAGRHGSAAA